MITPLSFYDLVETFPKPGCAICSLVARDVERYLDGLLYEYVMEADIQHLFRASRGMCNQHGWQLTQFAGGAMGIAVLCQVTLGDLLKLTDHAAPTNTPLPPAAVPKLAARWRDRRANANPGKSLAEVLDPTLGCPACQQLAQSQTGYVSLFDRYLDDERFFAAFQGSSGLCLPHLRLVLRGLGSSAHVGRVVSVQREQWARLHAHLEEFQAKYRHENQHLRMGEEADSWRRTIAALVGDAGVFGRDGD